MTEQRMGRREFLARTLAAAAFPIVVPASALGRDGNAAPSDRIVMGSIGVGRMGLGNTRRFLAYDDVRVLAVCDVREGSRQLAKRTVDSHYGDSGCATYHDYRELLAREDIDAVMIATPDHWHVLNGIEAARQGKHMYCEKPLGRTVAEDRAIRSAVHRYGVVFQFGTQQRSTRSFRLATELARNGRLGQLHTIMTSAALPPFLSNQPEEPAPPGFDYDMWLGPAPWAPYCSERCTPHWTVIYDYSLGCVGGAWAVHDVDIAQWANDTEDTCPVEIEGTGEFHPDGLIDTAVHWEVEQKYANGVRLINMDSVTAAKRAEQFRRTKWLGVLLLGAEGWVLASRSGINAHPKSLLGTTFGPNEFRLPPSNDHQRNFLDAVRYGHPTISPIDAAVNSDIICHQADIAMRLKRRKLHWDPAAEKFVSDPEANRMLSRAMRSPWHL